MQQKEEQASKPCRYHQKMLEIEQELGGSERTGFTGYLILFIGLAWSLFQMASAGFLLIDSIFIRALHLAFGISLVYLNIPFLKSKRPDEEHKGLSALLYKTSPLDYLFAILAAFSASYVIFDYVGIASRSGIPLPRDVVIGFMLVVLLLEGTRRVIGPTLPAIAMVFIAYVFSGPYLPDIMAFKGASISRFISQMTMDTEGIYGVPLHVSSTVVFLFVLFGTMLERAGGGEFFIRLALVGLGRYKGGAAKAAVVGSGLTGMISGSSIANVVTTGTFTIPLMKQMGYPATKAAAIEVAASTNGQLAPPVMGAAAFIIAEYVNVPYIEVAKAAAVPAFASYMALLWITHVEACKLGMQGLPKSLLPSLTETLREGWHFLIPILMLLYELVILQHSAELSVFRAILVLSVIMIGHPIICAALAGQSVWAATKESLKQWIESLSAGANNMAGVALATACAGIIVGCISLGLGQQITSFIEVLSMGNIALLLFITAIASLLLGMGLPTTANYIIMASLTAPVLVRLAANVEIHGLTLAVPLMSAHLYCFYFGILADDTPPVGLAAYAGAAIAEASPIATGIQGFLYDIRTAILPVMFFFNHDLILWGIDSIPLAFFIFIMTVLGCVCFASLVQGWFVNRNNIFEALLLLFGTIVFLNPFFITGFFMPFEQRYWGYAFGLVAVVLVFLMQRKRPIVLDKDALAAA